MSDVASCDATAFKAAVRDQWDRSAEGWDRSRGLLRSWLAAPTRAMLDLAQITPGDRVLDVAAGAGEQTLDVADRVGPHGYVLGTDISPRIVDIARKNAKLSGHRHVEFRVADGERLETETPFDAVVCRLGLMFFPDPRAGLERMFCALKPGGRAATMVFSHAAANPCIAILMETALKFTGVTAQKSSRPGGLLSLGQPGTIGSMFEHAGFTDVQTVTVSAPMSLAGIADYLNFVQRSAAPVADLLDRLAPPSRRAALREMAEKLGKFETAEGWEGPNELLLTVGRRPAAVTDDLR